MSASLLASVESVLALLVRWAERGWLRPLDHAFAAFLAREAPDAEPLLLLAAALASHQLGRGHVCLDLAHALTDPGFALSLPPEGDERGERPPLPAEILAPVDLARWQAALDHPLLVGDGPGASPLVLADTRLYLRRYWQYERDVAAAIDRRLAADLAPPAPALRAALDALFPPAPGGSPDWQKLACALAAKNAFAVVTGGPGTGKTTTVVKLLALLQNLAVAAGGRALRIRLAAPTGKAAARLNASIATAVDGLPLHALAGGEAVRQAIPREVVTVHRLLGSRPDTRRFRHDARNPLALDVLVIDEASMVDLEMMAAVLAALPPSARLVLLGDKDQLASVEAGAVLGELCRHAHEGRYTPATAAWLEAATGEAVDRALVDAAGAPLDQAVAMLRVSHRFTAGSGIGRLAEAVNAGDAARVRAVWASPRADVARLELGGLDEAAFAALVVDGGTTRDGDAAEGRAGYRRYLEALRTGQPSPEADPPAFDAWAQAVLEAHARFQLLCALRRGPAGVEGLNPRIARLLHERGLIPASEGWYLGRPVLVTHNDYGLGLMNGDVGLTLALPTRADGGRPKWALRVAFSAGDGRGGIRWVLPSRLQAVETVFAMTVHKAQGSEFEHAALLLPPSASPILTRELVYTGITRARSCFTLATLGGERVLEEAVSRRVQRASGLFSAPA